MSNTAARSEGGEICEQPFDQKNEALFQDRFHEGYCLTIRTADVQSGQ